MVHDCVELLADLGVDRGDRLVDRLAQVLVEGDRAGQRFLGQGAQQLLRTVRLGLLGGGDGLVEDGEAGAFGNGGAGVFHLKPDDENLGSLLELFTQLYREPVIVQRYLPEIRQGDKRIILVDGEPVGAVSRMPLEGEARANFHAGGSARKTELTAREREMCAAIGPVLREKGLVFVGIDVIGDYMTEINVTSPTGIQEINRLNGVQLEALLWDAIERRRAGKSGK